MNDNTGMFLLLGAAGVAVYFLFFNQPSTSSAPTVPTTPVNSGGLPMTVNPTSPGVCPSGYTDVPTNGVIPETCMLSSSINTNLIGGPIQVTNNPATLPSASGVIPPAVCSNPGDPTTCVCPSGWNYAPPGQINPGLPIGAGGCVVNSGGAA
jgi:hypothetical protein